MKYINKFINYLIYKIKYLFIKSKSNFINLNKVI